MMPPLAATPTPSSEKVDATDDEILRLLGRIRNGDPLPSNVITNVNPFGCDPWKTRDDIWYMCSSNELSSPEAEKEVKKTTSGYWKYMECDDNICTSNYTVGRKVTWEFFAGEVPSGGQIVWKIFEYKLKKLESETTEGQDVNSLCRVFCSNKDIPAHEESRNHESLNGIDDDCIQSALWSMLEQEEREIGLLEPIYESQIQGSAAVSYEGANDSRPNRSAELEADCDFSNGDFLELNDLDDLESSSSSSDNSSCASGNYDEYFNSGALLRDFENEYKLEGERGHEEHSFSLSSALRSERVIVQQPPQGSIQYRGPDVEVMGEPTSSATEHSRGKRPSYFVQSGNGGLPTSPRKESDSDSRSAGTSQGRLTDRVGRIARFGKKCFCFATY